MAPLVVATFEKTRTKFMTDEDNEDHCCVWVVRRRSPNKTSRGACSTRLQAEDIRSARAIFREQDYTEDAISELVDYLLCKTDRNPYERTTLCTAWLAELARMAAAGSTSIAPRPSNEQSSHIATFDTPPARPAIGRMSYTSPAVLGVPCTPHTRSSSVSRDEFEEYLALDASTHSRSPRTLPWEGTGSYPSISMNIAAINTNLLVQRDVHHHNSETNTPTSATNTGSGLFSQHGARMCQSCGSMKVGHHDFNDGEASRWDPHDISTGVYDLLGQALPTQDTVGKIYAAIVEPVDGCNRRQIVKIGQTTRNVDRRLGEIEKQHKIKFGKRRTWPNIPYLQLLRLERVIHADLAYFQRDLLVRTGNTVRTHHEYFEISLETAMNTIRFWSEKFQQIGLVPGRVVAVQALPVIQGANTRSLDESLESLGQHLDEEERWKQCNEQHKFRQDAWREAFDLCAASIEEETKPRLLTRVGSSRWGHTPMAEGYKRLVWPVQAFLLLLTAYVVRQLPTSSFWIMTTGYAIYKFGCQLNKVASLVRRPLDVSDKVDE